MSAPEVTLYLDLLSQPCRSVINFVIANKIPHKLIPINLMKNESSTPEFLEMNPHGTVPTARIASGEEQPLVLYESCTILRYLSEAFNVDDHWYNRSNLKRRCLIDQYLDWHHNNTRKFCSATVYSEFILHLLEKILNTKLPPVESQREKLPSLFEFLDSELGKHEFIIDNEISIADYMLYNEIIQLAFIKYDFSIYKNLTRYLNTLSTREEVIEGSKPLEQVKAQYI